MPKSKYLGMSWMLIALGGAAAVGLVGIAFYPDGLAKPELVFVRMVQDLFNPLSIGFILCGVLAASMSTMSSQILVFASVLSEDLYKHAIHKKATPAHLLTISRIGVIIVSAVSLLIAFYRSSTILEMVHYAWSGLGCAFGPLVLFALYSKKANKYGAMAGILVGGIIAGTWDKFNFYVMDYTIPAMIPGFILSTASIFIVSEITAQKNMKYENR